jgi:hypothetical protein
MKPKTAEKLDSTHLKRQKESTRERVLEAAFTLFCEHGFSEIAALLSYLRQLQRAFQLAVLVVHHARKDANSTRPDQALRGSSELHGWGTLGRRARHYPTQWG